MESGENILGEGMEAFIALRKKGKTNEMHKTTKGYKIKKGQNYLSPYDIPPIQMRRPLEHF